MLRQLQNKLSGFQVMDFNFLKYSNMGYMNLSKNQNGFCLKYIILEFVLKENQSSEFVLTQI